MQKIFLLLCLVFFKSLSVFSQKFPITINPGAYTGGFEIDSNGNGTFHQGVKTVLLVPGPHYINTGTGIIVDENHRYGAYIDFTLDQNGNISGISPVASAQLDSVNSATLIFATNQVTIDPAAFKGKYEISTYRHNKETELKGKQTIALIKAQLYYFEDEAYANTIIPGFTSGFYFSITENGIFEEFLSPSYTLQNNNTTMVLNTTVRKIDPAIFPSRNNGIVLCGYGYVPIKKPTDYIFITGLTAYAGYLDDFGKLRPNYFVP
ncbi:MAG: hypothetical protein NTY88_08430 [Bacteroidetes bacterium]|nr:hypothetical protein [Bacteroidota bacterium]